MVELALLVCIALETCVVVFAREFTMEKQTLVLLGTAVFHEKLTQFQLARRHNYV